MSVIVPVHNGGRLLGESLAALEASDMPRAQWELIVVDDASDDDTATVAARFTERVVRSGPQPRGPAFARNAGAALARGDVLVFVDADVLVHPDVLRGYLEAMSAEPLVAAVFGAYDTTPRAPGVVSQYRNLLHHYVHAGQPGDVDTFWAGCGAIRRSAFVQVGGFDAQRYPRPQIEDIALGYRLRSLGHRLMLLPELRCTHLKRWTLRSMIVTDLCDRGIPWMRLLLTQESLPGGTLNVRGSERVLTGLGMGAMLALLGAPILGIVTALAIVAGCLLLILVGNAPLLVWFARIRGIPFAVAVVPLRLLYYALNGVAVAVTGLLHIGGVALGQKSAVSSHPDRRAVVIKGSKGEEPL